jgi:hypothetical protein
MEISKMGSEECGEDLTYTLDLISHDIENLNFEEKNASHVNRMLSSNYAEPNLENLSYPPEQTL